MPDKYDEAVTYYTLNRHRIYPDWNFPDQDGVSRHACLFMYLGPSGFCGCPTQVNTNFAKTDWPELTTQIRAMEGLPHNKVMLSLEDALPDSAVMKIVVEALPRFAEAQRLADRYRKEV